MGDMSVYGYDLAMPVVDHMHERSHQHQPFFQVLTRKPIDPNLYPNYPDVDIRDAVTEYLVDIELPGIKNPDMIKCRWVGLKSLVVSGNTERPSWESGSKNEETETKTGTRDAKGEWKPPGPADPYMLVGERRIGPWKRHITFPFDVEMGKLDAKLEAGLLKLRIPKKGHSLPAGEGRVSITAEN
jgi:HSP20 family molecular chaperone IbpA